MACTRLARPVRLQIRHVQSFIWPCRFEIEFLSLKPNGLRHGAKVVAIRGPDAAAELGMLADLAICQKAPPPVLPALLQCPAAAGDEEPHVHLTYEPALAAARALSASALLNPEQSRCLQHAACWLSSQDKHQVKLFPRSLGPSVRLMHALIT